MAHLLTDLSGKIARRASYYRTVNALRAMPRRTAEDLGFDPETARLRASRAIYG